MSTAIIIRCQSISYVERELADALTLATGYPVFFAINGQPPADIPAQSVLPLNEASLEALGFVDLPGNWAWLCGDFCLYLARARLPRFSGYLLVENDVLGVGPAFAQLAALIEAQGHDAGAVRLRRHETPPKFSAALSQLGLDPHSGCIFPVAFASGQVIDQMAVLRKACLNNGIDKVNDEAILATTVYQHGFRGADLQQELPDLFRPDSFDTNPPHLREAVLRDANPGFYRPVLPLERILERIADPARKYNRHRLRRVLAGARRAERIRIRAALEAGN